VIADAEELLAHDGPIRPATRQPRCAGASEDRLQEARGQLAELQNAALARVKAAGHVTDEFVHENPWKSIGAAAGVGLRHRSVDQPNADYALHELNPKRSMACLPPCASCWARQSRSWQVRLALLSTEIQQEKLRVFRWPAMGRSGADAAGSGVSCCCAGSLWCCSGTAIGLVALGVLSALFLGVGTWLLLTARKHLQSPGGPFNTSVEELGRDLAELDKRSQSP